MRKLLSVTTKAGRKQFAEELKAFDMENGNILNLPSAKKLAKDMGKTMKKVWKQRKS